MLTAHLILYFNTAAYLSERVNKQTTLRLPDIPDTCYVPNYVTIDII